LSNNNCMNVRWQWVWWLLVKLSKVPLSIHLFDFFFWFDEHLYHDCMKNWEKLCKNWLIFCNKKKLNQNLFILKVNKVIEILKIFVIIPSKSKLENPDCKKFFKSSLKIQYNPSKFVKIFEIFFVKIVYQNFNPIYLPK
jgi:hypothetical protein